MLSVVMLNVANDAFMLSVVLLGVVAPREPTQEHLTCGLTTAKGQRLECFNYTKNK